MYKEYFECTDEEKKLIKDTFAILTNSKWIEDSFCEKYLYLLGHNQIVDLEKKKEVRK